MIAFRIDDLGFKNEEYQKLTDIFIKSDVKFSSGAIPFITESYPSNSLNPLSQIWQHGCYHKNNSSIEKNEFPENRNFKEVLHEISKGSEKLRAYFVDHYIHGFIPPWNRCSTSLTKALEQLSFKYLSSDKTIRTKINQINVNLDLHTNKEISFHTGRSIDEVIREVLKRDNYAFVMLHHNHMNSEDFIALEDFILNYSREHTIVWPTELL